MGRTPEQKIQHAAYMRQYRLDHPDYAERVRVNNRARYVANPDYYQQVNLKHKFGLTRAGYLKMLDLQHGVCAACGQLETVCYRGTLKRLAIDHDRSCCPGEKSCGKCIRGLLCQRCNQILGHIRDDPALLEGLAAYLRKFT